MHPAADSARPRAAVGTGLRTECGAPARAAAGADGAAFVRTTVRGTVDGVDIDGDRLLLSVDGVIVPLDAVSALRRPDNS